MSIHILFFSEDHDIGLVLLSLAAVNDVNDMTDHGLVHSFSNIGGTYPFPPHLYSVGCFILVPDPRKPYMVAIL